MAIHQHNPFDLVSESVAESAFLRFKHNQVVPHLLPTWRQRNQELPSGSVSMRDWHVTCNFYSDITHQSASSTASLSYSIANGWLDRCFSTERSPVKRLDSRTVHFLCLSDLDGTPAWYYRFLITLCPRCVIVLRTAYLLRDGGCSRAMRKPCWLEMVLM